MSDTPPPSVPPTGGPPPTPPATPTGPPAGPYVPPPGKPGQGLKIAASIVVVLALIGGAVALVLVLLGDNDGGDEAREADEVFLEPVSFEGESPFTESVGADVEPVQARVEGSVNGSDPGLYGGTQDNASCDRDQLVEFLEDNDAEAEAWAEVFDIAPDEIADFTAFLTPVQLRGDTRVTNHGFENGEANAYQAVLQAGTAVLVDNQGVPRVRCSCGNPLLEPDEAEAPTYGGEGWESFDSDAVQIVFADVDVDEFVLTDVADDTEFVRPIGTTGEEDTVAEEDEGPPVTEDLGTGDVQATVIWNSDDDMDLHVIDPGGEEIYFGSRTSTSGGELDADDIPGCGTPGEYVENVFWPPGGAPTGRYEVFVDNYSDCDGGPTDVTIQIRAEGDLIVDEVVTIAPDTESERFTFETSG